MFRNWLSQELEKRNWSQRKLARELGMSQTFVSNVIAGRRKPSVDFCTKLAEAFGEPPEKVFRLAGILPTLTDNQIIEEITELAKTLPEDKQKQLLEFAKFLSRK